MFERDPVKKTLNEIRKASDRGVAIARCHEELARCKQYFESVVRNESFNARKRAERRMPAGDQKDRIHDAVVGLLAVEEVTMDLKSIRSALELEEACKRMSKVMWKMLFMSDDGTLKTPGTVKKLFGVVIDDTEEPVTLSDRAELVDEGFIARMIQGVNEGSSVAEMMEELVYAADIPDMPCSSEPIPDFEMPADVGAVDLDKYKKMR